MHRGCSLCGLAWDTTASSIGSMGPAEKNRLRLPNPTMTSDVISRSHRDGRRAGMAMVHGCVGRDGLRCRRARKGGGACVLPTLQCPRPAAPCHPPPSSELLSRESSASSCDSIWPFQALAFALAFPSLWQPALAAHNPKRSSSFRGITIPLRIPRRRYSPHQTPTETIPPSH